MPKASDHARANRPRFAIPDETAVRFDDGDNLRCGSGEKQLVANIEFAAIDGALDLHGLTQAEAHQALRGFLRYSQARGARLVIIVTGKGGAIDEFSSWPNERGVLKRLTPQWLREPDLRSVVLGFEEAGRAHGGSGALYVRLRRLQVPSGRP